MTDPAARANCAGPHGLVPVQKPVVPEPSLIVLSRRVDAPRSHTIETSRSGRSSCTSCGKPIERGELRLSEAFVADDGRWAREHRHARTPGPVHYEDDQPVHDRDHRRHHETNPEVWARYHHLACAADRQPYKLRSALAASTLEIPDRPAIERAIERALWVADAAEQDDAHRDDYQQFVASLRERPDDDELLLVFIDWLQNVGDPRGELGAVQYALETATGDDKLRFADLESKLLAANRRQLVPDRAHATWTWRRGFIHRLALRNLDVTLLQTLAHPSLQLVRELRVDVDSLGMVVIAANLPEALPPTLRVVELCNRHRPLGAIGPLLAGAMPHLARLELAGGAELDDIAHPGLTELELGADRATAMIEATRRGEARTLVDRLPELSRRNLPALTRLILRVDDGLDDAVAALAGSDLIGGLRALTLHGDLSRVGLRSLRAAGAALDTIDVRGTAFNDVPILEEIARTVLIARPELQRPAADSKPAVGGDWLVRHTRRPEWGIGRVVEEGEHGVQVEFEHGGSRHVRNVELLEDVETPGGNRLPG